MKVLLCTPYLQTPGIIPGGINMWAHNLLCFRSKIVSDVDVMPISFDRKNYVNVDTNIFKRMYLGMKEISSAIKNVKKELDKQHFDVIHICTSASISLIKDIVLLYVARRKKVSSVIHFHFGRIPQLLEKNNWEWKLIKKILSLATMTITMDMQSYNALQAKGYKNVVYCPNPLSLAIMNQIEVEKGKFERIPGRLLFVGHVLSTKGVYELLEACKSLNNIELHIIGKAEENVKKDLVKIAKVKDDGQWLKFRGEIPHDEVLREMMKASIFVFPSYTEGFPNVILEAMACGCPIVTTSVGAIPEILDIANGNDFGICVDPKDVNAIKDAVKTFLFDSDYALQTGRNGVKRVNELYAVTKIWDQLVEIWRKVNFIA